MEGTPTFLADSICSGASTLAQHIKAKAIITLTHSGYTAIRVSSHRPKSMIFAFTNNTLQLHKLSLVWGIQPFYLSSYNNLDDAISESIKVLRQNKLLKEGDCVVHIGSAPLNAHERTNMMKAGYM